MIRFEKIDSIDDDVLLPEYFFRIIFRFERFHSLTVHHVIHHQKKKCLSITILSTFYLFGVWCIRESKRRRKRYTQLKYANRAKRRKKEHQQQNWRFFCLFVEKTVGNYCDQNEEKKKQNTKIIDWFYLLMFFWRRKKIVDYWLMAIMLLLMIMNWMMMMIKMRDQFEMWIEIWFWKLKKKKNK